VPNSSVYTVTVLYSARLYNWGSILGRGGVFFLFATAFRLRHTEPNIQWITRSFSRKANANHTFSSRNGDYENWSQVSTRRPMIIIVSSVSPLSSFNIKWKPSFMSHLVFTLYKRTDVFHHFVAFFLGIICDHFLPPLFLA
jgi:hypothetical protein